VLPHADAGVGRPEVDPDGRTLALPHLLSPDSLAAGLLRSEGWKRLCDLRALRFRIQVVPTVGRGEVTGGVLWRRGGRLWNVLERVILAVGSSGLRVEGSRAVILAVGSSVEGVLEGPRGCGHGQYVMTHGAGWGGLMGPRTRAF
jgi:hypothetical protein